MTIFYPLYTHAAAWVVQAQILQVAEIPGSAQDIATWWQRELDRRAAVRQAHQRASMFPIPAPGLVSTPWRF